MGQKETFRIAEQRAFRKLERWAPLQLVTEIRSNAVIFSLLPKRSPIYAALTKAAKLTGSAQVLFVRDVHAAAEHYRDAMGFSFGRIWGEPPSFAILERDGMHVMIKQIENHNYIVPRWTVSAGLLGHVFLGRQHRRSL